MLQTEMKIIVIDREPGRWPQAMEEALTSERIADPREIPATLLTDSAVTRNGPPIFLPDFAIGCRVDICVYFSIGRLGKSIPAKFAHRYFDGWGLAARVVRNEADLRPANALEANFDGAICAGPKMEMEMPLPSLLRVETLEGNGPRQTQWELSQTGLADLRQAAEQTVALVSRYMTLRNGDLVIPGRTGLSMEAKIGAKVKLTADGREALYLKIK